jgi:thiosulfate dehydrogenase
MKFTTFAWPFGIACITIAAAVLLLREPDRPPDLHFASADPPKTWPDYSLSGQGFRVPAGDAGPLIAYGHNLITRTFASIGPEVADHAMRFAGNNLACQNCHLDAGTNRYGLPLVGVFKTFPKFSPRDQRVISLTERLNECMTRSMNGRPLPDDSREMQALLAYMRYIGDAPPASVAPAAEPPPLAPDATRGASVFATVCAACHQPNGLGQRRGAVNDADGYVFPPLWGPDSFNDGAGMDHFPHIVRFVQRNMPRGVDPMHPQLTLQQAWDVAAYVISMPRPHAKASVR